jgi:aminoglycoside phosphotransferase (APT) family kinase protein
VTALVHGSRSARGFDEAAGGSAADVASALASLARRLRGPDATVSKLERLTAGASMQTWSFTVTSSTGAEDLILRRRTAASHTAAAAGVTAIGLSVEAALMRAVAARGVPVPDVVHVCDASDGLGDANVTRRVEGETLGRRIVRGEKFAEARERLARQCGQVIAGVHSTRPGDVGLRVEDACRTLDRYEASYRKLSSPRPVIELALRHLREAVPANVPTTLVHGDFRNGNLIIDPRAGVVAVLDWELSHLGDPAEDLGYICVNSWRFGASRLAVGGFGHYTDLLEGYRAAGGAEISMDRLQYWQMMGSLKWAVICMELYDSWVSGTDRSVERPMIGRRVTEAEIDLLTLLRART